MHPVESCPTCHEALAPRGLPESPARCGIPDPATLEDVVPIRCRLPLNHRSEEHWHPPILRGGEALVWTLAVAL